MDKKSDEFKCLNYAIDKCNNQHGVSKQIARIISGQDIKRDSNERPDFLRYSKAKDKKNGVVIGIEHFRVDHFSEKIKRRRVSSLGAQYEKEFKTSVETWHSKISEDADIPNEALESISNLVAQLLTHQLQSSYNTFIESFRYSLNKHLASVDAYHTVLDKYVGVNEKKLAFLIEVHSDFRRLFFHDKRGVHYGENIVPLFEDIVKILETIDSRKVDYLILCFGDTVFDNNAKVIAVPTRNLRKQFEKQNIPIYHYAGHDISLPGFQTPHLDFKAIPKYDRNGDNIDFNVTVSSRDISNEKKLEMVVDMYRYIKYIEQNNQNFATTDLVEMFYEVYDEHVSEIKNIGTNNIIKLIHLISAMNKEKLYRKFIEFESKWDIGESDGKD